MANSTGGSTGRANRPLDRSSHWSVAAGAQQGGRQSTAVTGIDVLFEPFTLNDQITMRNRIALSPCTRNRAENELEPTAGAVAYYASRADAGLLVTEATLINENCQGYIDTPGIWSEAQVKAWAWVTDAVHDRGGQIFSQIWHVGRLSHPHFTGVRPIGPSKVPTRGKRRQVGVLNLYHVWPRAMSETDIRQVLDDYRRAARNAKAAGFDGVEIHGANGYLPDQFLRQCTNKRTDAYGGSPQNRARFALEAVDAVASVFGPERVGLRLSPAAYFGLMTYEPGDNDGYIHLMEQLNSAGLAYLHVGIVDDFVEYDYLDGRTSAFMRRHYDGVLMGNGGYDAATAAAEISRGGIDLISFGRPFIANADLVKRLRHGEPLRPYSRAVLDELR